MNKKKHKKKKITFGIILLVITLFLTFKSGMVLATDNNTKKQTKHSEIISENCKIVDEIMTDDSYTCVIKVETKN